MELGVALRYPDYRAGFAAILAEEAAQKRRSGIVRQEEQPDFREEVTRWRLTTY